MVRCALLIDERDRWLGTVLVPDAINVIQHHGDIFVRCSEAVRLVKSAASLAVVFRIAEVYVREKLEPV